MDVEPAGMRGVARGGVAGLAGAGVTAASQFLTVLVVTRAFDAETAGWFFTLTSACLMLAGMVRLDAGNALIYFIARSRPARSERLFGYFPAALLPVVPLSLAVAAFGFACSAPAAAGVDGLPTAVRSLAVAFPVIVCAEILVGATRGFGSMRPTVLLGGVLQPVAQFVLVAALAFAAGGGPGAGAPEAGGGLGRLAAAWALPYLPVLVVSAAWLVRRVPRTPYVPGTAGDFWRHTGPRSLGSAVQNVFQRLDIVIVAALAGPVEAAVYTAATRFKVIGRLAGQGLAQAAQPALVRALAGGDLAGARALYQRTTIWLVLLTWPVWLAYAALAPLLLGVFGEGYAGGAGIALVLAATMMFASACGMADVALVAAGRTAASLGGIVLATTVTVALDLLLVPAHGALGAALGWSAGVVVKNALPLAQISRAYGLRPFGRHSLPAVLRPRSRPAASLASIAAPAEAAEGGAAGGAEQGTTGGTEQDTPGAAEQDTTGAAEQGTTGAAEQDTPGARKGARRDGGQQGGAERAPRERRPGPMPVSRAPK